MKRKELHQADEGHQHKSSGPRHCHKTMNGNQKHRIDKEGVIFICRQHDCLPGKHKESENHLLSKVTGYKNLFVLVTRKKN